MKNYHLVNEDGVYKVKAENAKRASKVINSKKPEAIEEARDFVKKQGGGSLKIHKNSGGFQEERTYPRSKDPRKSKG
jgi:hypothetical protein